MDAIDYRALFERELAQLPPQGSSRRELVAALPRIRSLITLAQRSGCGYYSSPEIESVLCRLAETLDTKLAETIEAGHYLMVMSEAYAIGGHTRVVERWIELDSKHRYSLVLTRQSGKNSLPERLIQAVKSSGGMVKVLDAGEDECRRAGELRDFASRFEKVILHIHTDDVVPLLAFGTDSFTRPVGLYNHADHLFWIGVGVADAVAELRKSKIAFSRRIRGVKRSQFVGIPMDIKEMARPDRAAAKRRLGLSPETRLLATCGSATKYDPVLGMDFLSVARRVLEGNPKAMLIGIGMTFKDLPAWKSASRELGGRIRVEGLVPFERLYDYYDAADLYLDSYPIGGGTALPDALCRGCPVLSLPSPDGKMDWVYDSGGYCETEDVLIGRANGILRGTEDVAALVSREYEVFSGVNSSTAFLTRVREFLTGLEEPHHVWNFTAELEEISDLDRYHLAENSRTEYLFGNDHSPVACYYRVDPLGKTKWVRVGGVEVCIKRKKLDLGVADV